MPLPKQSLLDLLGHSAGVQNLSPPHLAGIVLLYDSQTLKIHFQLDINDTNYLF